jgi:signal transduction histidine kinase/ActR/RegA family two-component response regulator
MRRLARIAERQLVRHRDAIQAGLADRRLADFLAASGDWLWETEGLRVAWASRHDGDAQAGVVAADLGESLIAGLVEDDADARAANAIALSAIRSQRPFHDLRVRRPAPDGGAIVLMSGVPVKRPDGAVVGYRGVARDVTAAHAARLDARRAENRLREAIEALDEVFVMTDAAGRIVLTNARWRSFNVRPGEPVPEDWATHVRAMAQSGRVRPADGDIDRYVESRTRARGDARQTVALRCFDRDMIGRDRVLSDGSCVTVFTDVTELVADRRAAQELAERLQLAASAAELSIYEADFDTGAVRPVVERDPGETALPGPASLDAFLARIVPEDRGRIAAAMRRIWSGELARGREEFTIEFEGSRHRVVLDAVLEPAAPGRPRRVVAVRRDVTALRQAEEAAREKAEADLANRAKSEFLSRVGHELRTPLNAIRGLAQVMLREGGDDGSARRAMVGHVVTASEHLAALLDDLLDMSRIETGRLAIRAERVSVAAVVRDCLRMTAPQAAGRGVTLEVGTMTPSLHAMADATRVRQILLNLLSNAISYNRPQGRVSLAAVHDPLGGQVRLSVTDTGPGLTRDEIARVFRPFERLSRGAGAASTEGLGLGLSIAQGLAQAMGGSIVVDSEPGRGTTFTVQLPAAEGGAEAPATATPASHASGAGAAVPDAPPATGGAQAAHDAAATGSAAATAGAAATQGAAPPRRVLYAEDNRLNGLLMRQIAGLVPGVAMRVVESGEQALAEMPDFAPDLLLLDHDLPGIDGHEVFRRVRAGGRRLPVILVSADATPESIERARTLGFDDYWVKPLDVEHVIEALGGAPGQSLAAAPLTGA